MSSGIQIAWISFKLSFKREKVRVCTILIQHVHTQSMFFRNVFMVSLYFNQHPPSRNLFDIACNLRLENVNISFCIPSIHRQKERNAKQLRAQSVNRATRYRLGIHLADSYTRDTRADGALREAWRCDVSKTCMLYDITLQCRVGILLSALHDL